MKKSFVDRVKDAFTKKELADLQKKLASISVSARYYFYFSAHYWCQLVEHEIPPARAIQELVQAWKALRKERCTRFCTDNPLKLSFGITLRVIESISYAPSIPHTLSLRHLLFN